MIEVVTTIKMVEDEMDVIHCNVRNDGDDGIPLSVLAYMMFSFIKSWDIDPASYLAMHSIIMEAYFKIDSVILN